jgi:type II secretory pathway component GspD/PulD (secretin)
MKHAAILAAVLVLGLSAAARAQDDASKALEAKIRTLRIEVDFKDFSVAQVADFIREVADINIVIDPGAEALKPALTMKVKGVTIRSILNLLLKPHKIGFVVEDGVLRILPESKLKAKVELVIIDVRDLLHPIRDFPGVEITLVDTGGAAFAPTDADTTPAEFPIIDLVKAHTGGKTWEENERASINLQNGLLFVRQTTEVIAQIRKVVAYLRQYK